MNVVGRAHKLHFKLDYKATTLQPVAKRRFNAADKKLHGRLQLTFVMSVRTVMRPNAQIKMKERNATKPSVRAQPPNSSDPEWVSAKPTAAR